jgi:hypothetical protein
VRHSSNGAGVSGTGVGFDFLIPEETIPILTSRITSEWDTYPDTVKTSIFAYDPDATDILGVGGINPAITKLTRKMQISDGGYGLGFTLFSKSSAVGSVINSRGNSDDTVPLTIDASKVTIGIGSVSYSLPITRGTNTQVLTSNGAGATTWEDPGTSPATSPWVMSSELVVLTDELNHTVRVGLFSPALPTVGGKNVFQTCGTIGINSVTAQNTFSNPALRLGDSVRPYVSLNHYTYGSSIGTFQIATSIDGNSLWQKRAEFKSYTVADNSMLSLHSADTATYTYNAIGSYNSGASPAIRDLHVKASAIDLCPAAGTPEIRIEGLRILKTRQVHIPDAGVGTEISTINKILLMLETHGLVATS